MKLGVPAENTKVNGGEPDGTTWPPSTKPVLSTPFIVTVRDWMFDSCQPAMAELTVKHALSVPIAPELVELASAVQAAQVVPPVQMVELHWLSAAHGSPGSLESQEPPLQSSFTQSAETAQAPPGHDSLQVPPLQLAVVQSALPRQPAPAFPGAHRFDVHAPLTQSAPLRQVVPKPPSEQTLPLQIPLKHSALPAQG